MQHSKLLVYSVIAVGLCVLSFGGQRANTICIGFVLIVLCSA